MEPLKKIIIFIALTVFFAWIMGYLFIPYFGKPYLVRVLSAELHRPVSLRELHFNPIKLSLRLQGLVIEDLSHSSNTQTLQPSPLLRIGELYVNLQAASLWQRSLVIEELIVTAPSVHLIRDGNQHYNVSDIIANLTKPSPVPSQPLRYSVSNIEIRNGTVVFDDLPRHARQIITNLQFALPFLSNMNNALHVTVKPNLTATFNGAPLRFSAQTLPFSATHDTVVQLKTSGVNLFEYLPYLPVALPFDINSAHLDSQVTVTFHAPPKQLARIQLTGRITLNQVSIQQNKLPLLSFHQLQMYIASSDLLRQKINFNKIIINNAFINVIREKNGGINILNLNTPSTTADASSVHANSSPSIPWQIQANQINVVNSDIQFTDLSTPQKITQHIKQLNASFTNFSTIAQHRILTQLSCRTEDGTQLNQQGNFQLSPFSTMGEVQLQHLQIAQYAPYFSPFVRFNVQAGNLDFSSHYTLNSSLHLDDALLTIKQLQLRFPHHKHNFLDLDTLTASGGQLDLAQHVLKVALLHSQTGNVRTHQNAQGVIDLTQLLSIPHSTPTTTPSTPWHWDVKQLALQQYAIQFFNAAAGDAPTLAAKQLNLTLDHLSDQTSAAVLLTSTIGDSGQLSASGSLTLSPFQTKLQLNAQQLAFVPLQSYLPTSNNIIVTEGTLSTQGQLALSFTPTLKLSFQGNAQIQKFSSLDKQTANPLLSWTSLNIHNAQVSTYPTLSVHIPQIQWFDFYSNLTINPDGSFNLEHILNTAPNTAEQRNTSVETGPTPTLSTSVMDINTTSVNSIHPISSAKTDNIQIGQINLHNGQVDFHDNYIEPNYSANISSLEGTVSGLSSNPAQRADIALTGQVNQQGHLSISGKVNPLSQNLYLDLLAKLTDFELSPLAPYAEKYAGYGIERGKLSFDVTYHIENGQLTAKNQLYLDQLTFGQKVDSPTATKLPVRLAMALLKNKNGNINIVLPISGTLNDPEFSMSGLLVQAFIHVIEKAVTEPFRLLNDVFTDDDSTKSYIQFADGSSDLSPTAQQVLHKLALAMIARPSLSLEIIAHADAKQDSQQLKKVMLNHLVMIEKFRNFNTQNSASTLTLTPDEYPKYLRAAYQHDKIPNKPHNFIGMEKTLPVPDMQALMLANMTINQSDLRQLADQRAATVRDYLSAAGVPSERVFVDAPKLVGQDSATEPATRVAFKLDSI